ncbi:MAG TPA: CopG family transcriptional regulator [Bryobacteraceae bacterium]|jgi:hypothetical protein
MTIYLDDDTAALVKTAVKATKTSQSQWVADAIRQRVRKEWPASVRALAGAWPDFPTADEIRKRQAADLPRETL